MKENKLRYGYTIYDTPGLNDARTKEIYMDMEVVKIKSVSDIILLLCIILVLN